MIGGDQDVVAALPLRCEIEGPRAVAVLAMRADVSPLAKIGLGGYRQAAASVRED